MGLGLSVPGVALQRIDGLSEVRHLPAGHGEVKQTEAGHRAAHPPRSDRVLQALETGLLHGVDQKKVVGPIAQAERMHPRQKRQHDARFKAQDDVEDDG